MTETLKEAQKPVLLKSLEGEIEARVGQTFLLYPKYSPSIWQIEEISNETHRYSTGRETRFIYLSHVGSDEVEDWYTPKKIGQNGKTWYQLTEDSVVPALIAQRDALIDPEGIVQNQQPIEAKTAA
jgi:hypothetical protein